MRKTPPKRFSVRTDAFCLVKTGGIFNARFEDKLYL